MTRETWKPVVGYEGSYEVSNMGRVRSVDRIITQGGRWGIIRRRHKGRILIQTPDVYGYKMVALGRANNRCVHRIVAAAFIGPRPRKNQVRHLDGDMGNNSAANIAYGTCSENRLDAVKHGTHYSYFSTSEGKRFATSDSRRKEHRLLSRARTRTTTGQFRGKT